MQQHAARGLVDVLGDRDELSAALANDEGDVDVVTPVARQAVNLVNNDEVRVTLDFQPLEHGLELRSVGFSSRFTGVDVDLEHVGVEALGLSQAGVSLGGD